jgi:hypothetical protein
LPYALLERVRLHVPRFGGVVLEESFAAEVNMVLHFPIGEFPAFQAALQELSAGGIQAKILETKDMLIRVSAR